MDSREKVIKGLIACTSNDSQTDDEWHDCENCPYAEDCATGNIGIGIPVMADALTLLKEQNSVEPKTEPSAKGYWYTCGVCGWWLFQVCDTVHFDDRKRICFCASCGKAVKWE